MSGDHTRSAVLTPALSPNDDTDGGNSNTAHVERSFEDTSLGILFVTMLIFLGGTFFMTQRRRIPLPYTVVLFLYGIVVGAVTLWLYPDIANALASIPPELLFYIFLPVLLFEGSYAINIHALKRVFFQVVLLATVGLLINTALLSLPIKLCFGSWSWYTALLLGSLLSATDPVAVVALLKELGVDKCMTALVDGESVMNDGTAIILFSLFLPAAQTGSMSGSVGVIILKSVRLSLLPVLVGPIFGFLQSFWLRRTADGLTKACITVSVTYVSYYVASHLIRTSGVLTLFFQGVFLSYYCPSLFPGKEGNLISSTWEFLVHLGNTVLFSLVGVILVAEVIPTLRVTDVFVILGIYVAMILSRLIMLEILAPCLNVFSYKVTQHRIALLVHAGLRGGVAATLALAVKQSGLKEGITVLKITSGIVLLTLLVNATTARRVVRRLGFYTKEEFRVLKINFAMECVRSSQENALESVKRDTKYRNASWMQVEKFVRHHLRNPLRGVGVEKEPDEDKTVNRMLMSAFKTALWRQRDEEVITETVVMQMGTVIAGLIERGELLDVQQMHFFHRKKGNPEEAAAGEEELHTRHPMSPSTVRRRASQPSPVSHLTPEQQQQLGPPRLPSPQLPQPSTKDDRVYPAQAAPAVRDDEHTARVTAAQNRGGRRSRERSIGGESSRGDGPTHTPTPTLKARRETFAEVMDVSGYGADGGNPCAAAAAMAAVMDSTTNHRSFGDPSAYEAVRVDVLSPPPGFVEGGHGGAEDVADAARMNRVVEALMRRLLPTWVIWAERFIFGKGYFAQAHRRAQENAFVTLLAVVKCLTVISPLKYKYVTSEAQARRVEGWMSAQMSAANRAIRFFYANFPEATNNVASSRAVVSVANSLVEAVNTLHSEQGFGTRGSAVLMEMVTHMRAHVPTSWENNAEQKESNLVLRAVAATTLGKGLRTVEIKAISSMGLVRKFREGEVITLPENAFLVVVFGCLRAMHGQWTTLTQHEMMESFGDTVGLEALMLPPEFRLAQQRRWRVISTESTALLISFNSIKPFLMERSFRAVKALWRAAAVEVILPFLSRIVTVPENQMQTKREHLMELILAGTPLIGPQDCDLASCETNFHLYFYLRGTDKCGLFSRHTPPCYISTFYVHQLRWSAPDAVLYAVPMRVGDRGYVSWAAAGSNPSAIISGASPAFSGNDDDERAAAGEDEEEGGSALGGSMESHFAAAELPRSSPISSIPHARAAFSSRSPRHASPAEPPLLSAHRHPTADDLLPLPEHPVVEGREGSPPEGCLAAPSTASPDTTSIPAHADGEHLAMSVSSSLFDHGSATPPLVAYGESTASTHMGATSIINNVLLGTIPDETAEGYYRNGSISVFGDLLDTVASPRLSHRDGDNYPTSPCTSDQPSRGASTYHFYPESSDISIFYTLEKFVTPVPFTNQVFVHYASALEHLCIAALRYLRFPADPFHVQHAQTTGEQTVEFLLNFCVELSVLKRTCRVVSKRHNEDTDVLNPFHASNDVDTAFQAKVCTWARQYRVNGKFHLRVMVTEMNMYANRRFPDYVALLRRMVELEPELKAVETAEGMNGLCRRVIGSYNPNEAARVKMERLEDAL
ncbi:Na/H antiporter-like protein [Leptomonas pyrrhocoris]|uniref:Na/H antiporter-like protein n=1 Tax=Leptomonas pyrrhocoris TaxID=157538 RepID=A0A0N0DYB4_LEPPY|nr:Na/H antiporter-like protein [Leptomonas pyrrhocoris]KPA83965.1 Na/H antiporter-like protein [Leptomonas pyrrhocoris]|eukprot:XP_015662404.1 Na/H antiporter-like protein [Leptomonas pyrrhocoris]